MDAEREWGSHAVEPNRIVYAYLSAQCSGKANINL
jgi:hypothetical protein